MTLTERVSAAVTAVLGTGHDAAILTSDDGANVAVHGNDTPLTADVATRIGGRVCATRTVHHVGDGTGRVVVTSSDGMTFVLFGGAA